ncbi:MAG: oligosaccharide flippase family protein [Micromonosporaceae bacterium]|nr:oligosaccharide flippase family protein [Micromonosporaceae bacterium]
MRAGRPWQPGSAAPVPGSVAALLPSGLTAGHVAFALASLATSGSSVAFHLLTGLMLGPAEYGALGAIVAVIAVLAVPVAAVETMVASQVARRLERNLPFDSTPTMRRALTVGAAAAGSLAVASPMLSGFMRFDSVWPLLVMAASCLPMAGSVVPWGMLCGQRRFGTCGVIVLAGAIVRVGLAAALVHAGWGVVGALAASLCADCLRAGLMSWQAQRGPGRIRGSAPLRVNARRAVAGTTAMGALQALLGIDTLLARHYLPAHDAGLYVAATMAAQTVFYASQIACTLAIPEFAVGDGAVSKRKAALAVTVTVGLGLVATAALAMVGPLLLPLAFGDQFRVPSTLLAIRGLTTVALSVLALMIRYRLSRGHSPGVLTPLLGVMATLAAAALFHSDSVSLACAAVLGAGCAMVPLIRYPRGVPNRAWS